MPEDRPQPLIDALQRWNPWWQSAPYDHGIERDALNDVMGLWLGQSMVLAICGMRRCGKTTLMKQIVHRLVEDEIAAPKEILFANLEEPIFLEERADVQALERVFQAYMSEFSPTRKPWVFLDEIQNIEGWAGWVRAALESNRAHLIVSGSSSKLLEPDLASKLTGRSITRTLWPLSLREFERFSRVREGLPERPHAAQRMLPEYLRIGGLPRMVLEKDPTVRDELYKQYFRDILHRDVVGRHEIRSPRALEEVAHHYLSNTARPTSITSIKNKYELAVDQVRTYTEHLIECYLIGGVSRFSYKAHVRTRSPLKVYARDTGLRNAVAFRFSPDLGPLAETATFNHLSRTGQGQVFYYNESSEGAECDFVVWRGDSPVQAIQVCYSDRADLPDREERGLLAAMKALDISEGLLLTADAASADPREVDGRIIHRVPLWQWLNDPGVG